MTRPRRATPAGLAAALALGLVLAVLAALAPATPVGASTSDTGQGDTGLSTTITSVSPTRLTDRTRDVTVAGRVTNSGDEAWTDVQAYLVVRREPFASRDALVQSIATDPGYAGPRIVDVGRFDEMGDLPAGSSRAFRITIPAEELPISGADGVYPVGVQILATDSAGSRGNDAVSRAVTLLPRLTEAAPAVPTTVVWPFLMPVARSADGAFAGGDTLMAALRPGGRLSNLLTVAEARDADGRGIIVDPALVQAADDLARGRGLPDLTEADRADAARFRDRLVVLGSDPSAWVLDYDRADVLGLSTDAGQRRRLTGAVERATEAVVKQFGLSTTRVSWPTRDGVTRGLLTALRTRGDDPVLVSSPDLPDWEPLQGAEVAYSTTAGDLPLLVNDNITRDLPGRLSGATLRQRILSTAALASLSRSTSPGSRAAAVVVVDPTWNPRTDDAATRAEAPWSAPFTTPVDLDRVDDATTYRGSVPTAADARPVDGRQLAAADDAFRLADLLSAASDDSQAVDDERARDVAGVLGVRWRSDRSAGTANARAVAAAVEKDLGAITVMGPAAVTLSSAEGAFPLTISNGSRQTVSVGVQLESSNPALDLPEQEPVEIGAGERQTLTVDVDLEQQNATTVTARLVTEDGRPLGASSEFIVRSSRVGAVLWVTMAAAALFVLVALARRFRTRKRSAA